VRRDPLSGLYLPPDVRGLRGPGRGRSRGRIAVPSKGISRPGATVVVQGGEAQGYQQNIDDLALVWTLVYTDPITGNDASYDTDWQIENFGGGDITLSRLADAGMEVGGAGCRFAFVSGVSDAGESPRIQRNPVAALAVLGISIPFRFSVLPATSWGSFKLASINQVGAQNHIPKLSYGDFGEGANYYVDLFTADLGEYLNDWVGTGQGDITPIEADVEYELEIRLTVSGGRLQWWVRNVDAGTPPALQGDYSGYTIGNMSNNIQLTPQQSGFGEDTCPTTFDVDFGQVVLRGTAA
jgi:hypothetical protein